MDLALIYKSIGKSNATYSSEVFDIAEQCGRPCLSKGIFKQRSDRISVATVLRRFGSWQAALEETGLLYGGPTLTERMMIQPGRRLSNDDVIAEMKRVQALVAE